MPEGIHVGQVIIDAAIGVPQGDGTVNIGPLD